MPEDMAVRPDENQASRPAFAPRLGDYEERGYTVVSGRTVPAGRPPRTPSATPPAQCSGSSNQSGSH
ncbi:hypothetical protein CSO01_05380 [Cellulomonas soli]|uniref:Uncharacterized protein n=1 Tax=Cellulomonas soli TaxID=931535 RepID=A0A512P9E7_9CELL|nr:hypothetical protein [Cellulomonas soli]GEP67823.1 hypothetical protein CSO01_05380 [Cellulomonas soli]